MQQILDPFGVTCIDAEQMRTRVPMRILRGWELKAYSLAYTCFNRVLLLAADNCPVQNPDYLIYTQEFIESGAVFWPDYDRLGPERDLWQITQVEFRDEPECETGQVLVDRQRTWPGLWLALSFNAHSDFYYHFTMGDKDSFHMAFRRLGMSYSMPQTPIYTLDGCTMCQHDFSGRRLFQHRNLDKWRLDGGNRVVSDFLFEDHCQEFLSELRGLWSDARSSDVLFKPPLHHQSESDS